MSTLLQDCLKQTIQVRTSTIMIIVSLLITAGLMLKNAWSVSSIQTHVTPVEKSSLFQKISHVIKILDHVRMDQFQYGHLLAHVERTTLERIISRVTSETNTLLFRLA